MIRIHAQSSSIHDIYKYIRHIRRIYGEAVRGISKVRFPTARYISVFPAHEKWICRLAGGSLNFPELTIPRNIQTRKEPPHASIRRDVRIDSIKGVYGNRLLQRISIGILCGPSYVRRIWYWGEHGIKIKTRYSSILFHYSIHQLHSTLINNYLLY